MYIIDISSLKKEGEFGSKEWGEACAAAAVKILEAADLPADFDSSHLFLPNVHES